MRTLKWPTSPRQKIGHLGSSGTGFFSSSYSLLFRQGKVLAEDSTTESFYGCSLFDSFLFERSSIEEGSRAMTENRASKASPMFNTFSTKGKTSFYNI